MMIRFKALLNQPNLSKENLITSGFVCVPRRTIFMDMSSWYRGKILVSPWSIDFFPNLIGVLGVGDKDHWTASWNVQVFVIVLVGKKSVCRLMRYGTSTKSLSSLKSIFPRAEHHSYFAFIRPSFGHYRTRTLIPSPRLQCSCSGWPKGNGNILSSSLAQLGQATCLPLA